MMTSASTFSDTADIQAETAVPGAEIAALPQRPFVPQPDTHYQHGQPTADDVQIIVTQAALKQVQQHSISNLRSELGGVLLGHAFRDGRQLWLEITAVLPAASSDHGPVHFKFSADSWKQIQADKESQYPDLEVVGWYHTHPGLRVFYSSDDVVVHSAAFTLPWQVGFVVDPLHNEACFFGWRDGTLTPFGGYYERLDESPKKAAPWHVVQTAVWHELAEFEQMPDGTLPTQHNWLARPAATTVPTWGVVAMLAAGVLFFLCAGWALAQNRRMTQLEQMVLTLADTTPAELAATCPDARLRLLPFHTAYAVGARVDLLGTAALPAATRYHVEMRPANTDATWQTIATRRAEQPLGLIGRWDTRQERPGAYELRLTAVDRSNLNVQNMPTCQTTITLIAP